MTAGVNQAMPPVVVQAGFASTPLATPQTWTDVSKLVKAIRIKRGRQHGLGAFNPGTCLLTLWGVDRSVDPTNTSSPFAPGVDVNKQIQVLVNWNLLSLAVAGSPISGGWTAGANTTISYPSSVLKLTSVAAGAISAQTATGTAGVKVVPGSTYSAMASFQAVATGESCSITLTWYTAAGAVISSATGTAVSDVTSGYTQATVQATAPATAAFCALSLNVATTTAAGEGHKVQNAGVFPFPGVTTWQPGGPVPLFTGFLDQLDPVWLDNLRTDDQLTATDSMRLLSSDLIVSTYLATITADGATNVWPMGDNPTSSSNVAADVVGSLPGQYIGGYQLGVQGPSFTDPTTAFQATAVGAGMLVASSFFLGPYTAEFWFMVPSLPNTSQTTTGPASFPGAIANGGPLLSSPSAAPQWPGDLVATSIQVNATGQIVVTDNNHVAQFTTSRSYCDGVWHHAVLSVSAQDGNGNSTGSFYLDGTLIGAALSSWWLGNGTGAGFMFGSAVYAFASSFADAAFYNGITLTATQVLNHYDRGFTGFPVQDSGSRISSVLSALGALAPPSSIALGISNVSQPQGALTATSVLTYIQQIEQAEGGYLFTSAGGVLTFLNRQASIQAPRNVSQATFGDAAGEVPYQPKPDIGIDVADLRNRSLVSRQTGMVYIGGLAIGGTASTPQVAQDTTSQAKYAQAATKSETGLLLTNDQECLARAQWNVSLFANPKPRVRSLSVNPLADPVTRFPAVLFRELLDRVTVKRRPWDSTSGTFGSPIFQQDEYIESISHEIDFSKGPSWTVTYSMWPALTQQFWILGDATLGVLGSTTRLAW